MGAKIDREKPISITRIRDYHNAFSESSNEESYETFSMSDLGIDSSSSTYDYMLAQAKIKHHDYDDDTLRNLIKNAQNNDEYSLNKVLESHLLVPFHVLKKYISSEFWEEDLIQEGNIAICKAIMTYKYDSDVQFSSYLYANVKNAMLAFLKKVNPKMTTVPPSEQLRKYITTTELNNLVNNFTDLRDLKQRISNHSLKVQQMICEYVTKRLLTIISFEENEEEVLEELANSTNKEYVDTVNWSYIANLQALHDYTVDCALTCMTLKRFYIYCEFNGLFGFEFPENREKRLKELSLSEYSIDSLNKTMLYRVYYNEEFEVRFGTLTRNLDKTRGYYYERI